MFQRGRRRIEIRSTAFQVHNLSFGSGGFRVVARGNPARKAPRERKDECRLFFFFFYVRDKVKLTMLRVTFFSSMEILVVKINVAWRFSPGQKSFSQFVAAIKRLRRRGEEWLFQTLFHNSECTTHIYRHFAKIKAVRRANVRRDYELR